MISRILISLLVITSIMSGTAQAETGPASSTERYLIIGSYLAEIVVELGAADQVVGVSGGTGHIKELTGVPVIPGFRNTSAETMLSLGPTVALLAGRQTRPEIVGQLEDAGVTVHFFADDVASLDLVPQRIGTIGEILGREAEAVALSARFTSDLAEAKAFAEEATTRPKGLFILSGGGRPTVVAGGDTHIALLIALAGAENVTGGISYFKPMSQEAMLAAAPEFILVNQEGLDLSGGVPTALKAPGALLTPAGQNGNVFAIPNGLLQGLGLNSPKAIRAIASHIHPELSSPAKEQ